MLPSFLVSHQNLLSCWVSQRPSLKLSDLRIMYLIIMIWYNLTINHTKLALLLKKSKAHSRNDFPLPQSALAVPHSPNKELLSHFDEDFLLFCMQD